VIPVASDRFPSAALGRDAGGPACRRGHDQYRSCEMAFNATPFPEQRWETIRVLR